MLIIATKKKQALALMSALFLATAINAAEQSSPSPEVKNKHGDRFEALSQKLQLTEKQKTDLKPMIEKLRKNREETIKKLDEQELKELSTVLKPEQASQVSRYLKRGKRIEHGMKNRELGSHKFGGPGQEPSYPKPPSKLPPKE